MRWSSCLPLGESGSTALVRGVRTRVPSGTEHKWSPVGAPAPRSTCHHRVAPRRHARTQGWSGSPSEGRGCSTALRRGVRAHVLSRTEHKWLPVGAPAPSSTCRHRTARRRSVRTPRGNSGLSEGESTSTALFRGVRAHVPFRTEHKWLPVGARAPSSTCLHRGASRWHARTLRWSASPRGGGR